MMMKESAYIGVVLLFIFDCGTLAMSSYYLRLTW
jgi:hypothetical protein